MWVSQPQLCHHSMDKEITTPDLDAHRCADRMPFGRGRSPTDPSAGLYVCGFGSRSDAAWPVATGRFYARQCVEGGLTYTMMRHCERGLRSDAAACGPCGDSGDRRWTGRDGPGWGIAGLTRAMPMCAGPARDLGKASRCRRCAHCTCRTWVADPCPTVQHVWPHRFGRIWLGHWCSRPCEDLARFHIQNRAPLAFGLERWVFSCELGCPGNARLVRCQQVPYNA